MTSQSDVRIASITLFVSEYLPRIHGFEVILSNGSRSGKTKTKYRCREVNLDLLEHDVSRVGLKVDSMMGKFQCYTGIRVAARQDGVERMICEEEFADGGEWVDREIPEGQRLIGLHGSIFDGFFVARLGCSTVKIA